MIAHFMTDGARAVRRRGFHRQGSQEGSPSCSSAASDRTACLDSRRFSSDDAESTLVQRLLAGLVWLVGRASMSPDNGE